MSQSALKEALSAFKVPNKADMISQRCTAEINAPEADGVIQVWDATTGAGSPLSALQKEKKINLGICTKSWGIQWWGRGAEKCWETLSKGQVIPSAMCAPDLRRGRLGRRAAAAGEPRAGRGAEGDCQGPWASAHLYTPKTETTQGRRAPLINKRTQLWHGEESVEESSVVLKWTLSCWRVVLGKTCLQLLLIIFPISSKPM